MFLPLLCDTISLSQICKIGATLSSFFQEVFKKDASVWLDGTGAPPMYVFAQTKNTFGELADFFGLGNTPNIPGGFINKKIRLQLCKKYLNWSYTMLVNPLSVEPTCQGNRTPTRK